MSEDLASVRATRSRAKYAFSGAGTEIDKSLPLEDPDEEVLIKGRAMERYAIGLTRLVAVRLTTRRLAVLSHYFFKPDQLIEIPAGALLAVGPVSRGLDLTYRDHEGVSRQIRIVAATGARVTILDPLFGEPDQVISTFQRWLAGNPPH